MIKLIAFVLLCAVLSGCAIAPNTIEPHFEHVSHATQHVGDNQTHYGVNAIGVSVRWGKPTGFFLELGENTVIDKCTVYKGERQCGGLMGPRETFEGRVGYVFTVH